MAFKTLSKTKNKQLFFDFLTSTTMSNKGTRDRNSIPIFLNASFENQSWCTMIRMKSTWSCRNNSIECSIYLFSFFTGSLNPQRHIKE